MLYVANQLPLRAGVAVDVALGRLDGSVACKQLHVAQAAAGAMDIAGGDRDEAAPARMGRAPSKPSSLKRATNQLTTGSP